MPDDRRQLIGSKDRNRFGCGKGGQLNRLCLKLFGTPVALAFVFHCAPVKGQEKQECRPAAAVDGDPDLVEKVKDALVRSGVSTKPDKNCPSVKATVRRRETDVSVDIEDPYGRKSRRVVAGPETAAAVVESWARRDLSDPLLASLLAEQPGPVAEAKMPPEADTDTLAKETARTAEVEADSDTGTDEPTEAAPSVPWRALFGLDGEASVDVDRSTWFGGNASGCARMNLLCAGAMARVGFDPGLSGDSKRMNTTRIGTDLVAFADLPFEWGIVSLLPGIGIGAGWMRIKRALLFYRSGDSDICLVGEDQDDGQGYTVQRRIDAVSMRLNAHAVAAVTLGGGLALAIGISADLLLFAHAESFEESGQKIAGEPRALLRGSLGLRYGLP